MLNKSPRFKSSLVCSAVFQTASLSIKPSVAIPVTEARWPSALSKLLNPDIKSTDKLLAASAGATSTYVAVDDCMEGVSSAASRATSRCRKAIWR